ncbi:uncharacterized protein K441DRAFT_87053 [Cenococcum geophilum 1.58]|uniref:uncharacterized protein n=1 Tax=Cenococcum geophilum 1.58 TaxID=794803 RepID=UPI00358F5C95|nr:hypothetical protein K441DRAFT_87053 [Cenococcum geophilum 1.58]
MIILNGLRDEPQLFLCPKFTGLCIILYFTSWTLEHNQIRVYGNRLSAIALSHLPQDSKGRVGLVSITTSYRA